MATLELKQWTPEDADADDDDAGARHRKAWARVAEGYRLALTELSASDEEFARMVRGERRTRRLAGLPVLRSSEGSR